MNYLKLVLNPLIGVNQTLRLQTIWQKEKTSVWLLLGLLFYSIFIPNLKYRNHEKIITNLSFYAHLNIKHSGNKWRLVDLKCLTQHDNFFVRPGNYYNKTPHKLKCLLQSDQTLTETFLIISDQEKHIFRTNILGQSIEDANCKFFVHFYVGIIWQVLLFTSDTPGGWVFLFQTKNIHCFFPFQRCFFFVHAIFQFTFFDENVITVNGVTIVTAEMSIIKSLTLRVRR